MISRILSYGILGIDAYPIEVEVDVSSGGLPVVNLVGLADIAIKESKVRVKTAIKNSGFEWPGKRITISLAPSHIKKRAQDMTWLSPWASWLQAGNAIPKALEIIISWVSFHLMEA